MWTRAANPCAGGGGFGTKTLWVATAKEFSAMASSHLKRFLKAPTTGVCRGICDMFSVLSFYLAISCGRSRLSVCLFAATCTSMRSW